MKPKPVNIIFNPHTLEVNEFSEKIKLQMAFYRNQKVCKTPPMRFFKKDLSNPSLITINTEDLQFCTTLQQTSDQKHFQNKVVNIQMAIQIDKVKYEFDEKINISTHISPCKQANNFSIKFSDNPFIKLKCGVTAHFSNKNEKNEKKTVKKVQIAEEAKQIQNNEGEQKIKERKMNERRANEERANEHKNYEKNQFELRKNQARSQGKILKPEEKNFEKEYETKLAKVQQQFKETREKMKAEHQNEIEELEEKVKEYERKLNEDNKKIKNLQLANKNLQKTLSHLELTNKNVSKSFKDLQKANDQLKINISSITSNKVNISQQNERTQDELKYKNSMIRELEEEVLSLKKQRAKLEEKLVQGEKVWEELRQKYKQSEKKNVSLTSSITEGQYKEEKLKKEKEELMKRLKKQENEYEEEIQNIRQSFNERKINSMKKLGMEGMDLDKMKSKIQSLEKELQSKKQMIKLLGERKENKENQLKGEHDHLKHQNTQLKEELKKYKSGEENENVLLEYKILNEKVRKECEQAKKNQKNLLIEKSQVEKQFNSLQDEIIKSKEVIATVLNLVHEHGSDELITLTTDCIA